VDNIRGGSIPLMPTMEIFKSKSDPNSKTLEEAISYLDNILSDEAKTFMRTERNALSMHHTLGRWMRNEWGLWGTGSELKQHLQKEHGQYHPDGMSSLILKSYSEHLSKNV
jgi:Domain of unknown function (DUF6794)